MTLTPTQRLQLTNQILPQEAGSLRESVKIKRMRDKIGLTDEELDQIEINPETGSFNPEKLDKLDDLEIDFDSQEREIIGVAFVSLEDEGSIPTNDGFVELVEKFGDAIEQAKKDLSDNE
jgi:predicted RND superfamily exporter protein